MFYLMHCGGMPFDGATIQESGLGGSETAAYYVAHELARRGHRVTLFTNQPGCDGLYDGVKYVWAGEINAEFPLGDRFHMYATMTPVDVCLIQRSPYAFVQPWSSKVNMLWLHDLALGRNKAAYNRQMWAVDGVLTVSEWHREQVVDSWGLNERVVHSIENGVDLSLYDRGREPEPLVPIEAGQKTLIYCSRPERGLENLVKPGGIMDRLWERDQSYRLWVCGYDNVTPAMAGLYDYLYRRIEELPNAVNLGSLSKQQLADAQRLADALVYPTTFSDTSCIVAMESMAAGIPFISSEVAALPETCEGSGAILLPLENGDVSIGAFVEAIIRHTGSDKLREKQLAKAQDHTWDKVVDQLENVVGDIIGAKRKNVYSMALHLRRNSDIMALRKFLDSDENISHDELEWIEGELNDMYGFAFAEDSDQALSQHYNAYAAEHRCAHEEELMTNSRFRAVLAKIADNADTKYVLDYGAAHGHYAINIAKALPHVSVDAVDVDQTALDFGRAWAMRESVNVAFHHADAFEPAEGKYDVLLLAEVLEHVPRPWELLNRLLRAVKPGGLVVLTTPFGPWEYEQYERESPWRFHLWHLDRQDLHDMVGHCDGFGVNLVYSASSGATGEALGSYITTFRCGKERAQELDQQKRLARTVPTVGSVSCCMIVGSSPNTIRRSLDSALPLADEFIIALDQRTIDERTIREVEEFEMECSVPVEVYYQESPTVIGFDAARNTTITRAHSEWILWLDADEYIQGAEQLRKALRHNQYDAYAIKQHHFSLDPAGILKTDLPTKLFRNDVGIQFYGVVHEHPEKGLNQGAGHAQLIHDVSIAHEAYVDERVRRERFQRNIPLMVRDRQQYPERVLGKFLWIRDLSHMIRYELEKIGEVTEEMREQARHGIELWDELVALGETRMLLDGMEYYDVLAGVLGADLRAGFMLGVSRGTAPDLRNEPVVESRFLTTDHLLQLQRAIIEKRTEDYGDPFY